MAITKADENTPIAKGQWACRAPLYSDAISICAAPRRVSAVQGKRIHLERQDGTPDSFVLSKSVVYVCDTQAEADAVYAISREQAAALSAARKQLTATHAAKIAAMSPQVVTFDQFVQYGCENGGNIVNGMPWHFKFKDMPVTHHTDVCYLILKGAETLRFTPDDVLVIDPDGSLSTRPAAAAA
jgi:hypothetical protein